MAQAVTEGRKAVNFSEWAAYSPDQQRTLLAVSCDDATSGRMPGPYTLVRPRRGSRPRTSRRSASQLAKPKRTQPTDGGSGENDDDNHPRNQSPRLSGSEAYRGCRRVARQQPPPRVEFDLSPVEEDRSRCLSGESAHADVRG